MANEYRTGNRTIREERMSDKPTRGRLRRCVSRIRGRCGLAWRRAIGSVRHTAPRRTLATLGGLTLAVAIVVVVSGLAIGMTGVTTLGDDETYWIVPEAEGERSPLVAAADPQFGGAHEAREIIAERDGVESVTPLLIDVLPLETSDGEREHIVVVGIIPDTTGESPLGLSTEGMTAGAPYYGSGSYDGQWTGEAVLSEGAATRLGASTGATLDIAQRGERNFTVAGIAEGEATGLFGTTPIAMVHLAELQSILGADTSDQADQFAVEASDPSALESVYENAAVLSSSELFVQQVTDSDVAMALGLGGLVVGLLVGVLFLVTSMALEVVGNRREMWSLAAIGVSRRARLWFVGGQSMILVLVGGVLGGGLGLLGLRLVNVGAGTYTDTGSVAATHPLLGGYGLGVALVIGVLTLPILWGVLSYFEGSLGGRRG